MIRFNCPSCSGIIKTSDENEGRRAKCAHCGQPVTMPVAGTDTVGEKPAKPVASAPIAATKPEAKPAKPKPKPAPVAAKAVPVVTPKESPQVEPKKAPKTEPAITSAPAADTASTPGTASKSRKPLVIGAAIAAAAVVAIIIFVAGNNGAPPDKGNLSTNTGTHSTDDGASANTGSTGHGTTTPGTVDGSVAPEPVENTATVKSTAFEISLMKPVNVGAAVDRNKELAIPTDAKLSLPPAKPASPRDVALVAQQLSKLLEAADPQLQKHIRVQTAGAWAMARDRDKAMASLSADPHPMAKALVLTELGRAHLLAGDRSAAKAAADEALTVCTQPPSPAAAKDGPNASFVMRRLADLFGQLGDERSQTAATVLASAGARPQRPVDAALITLMSKINAGDMPGALKAADALPPELARAFYYWLARQHEDRDEKPAAAALYLRSLRLEKPGANPANDGRLVFDSMTHEAVTGLLRCGARTPAIEQILALPPSQLRRQAYLEMAVSYLSEQGDHATAIAAAINGGHPFLAAEAQLKAGLNADAAASLKRVVAGLPPVVANNDFRGDGRQSRQARLNLLFEIARLQCLAGDGEGATQTIDKVSARFSPVPTVDATPGTQVMTTGDDHLYIGDNSAAWQSPRLRAAELYAAAGRYDRAVQTLDSIVAMNSWFVAQLTKANSKNIPPVYQPTQGPHRYQPLIDAAYAGHLFRAGKKDEAAAQFDKAITAELAAMAAVKLPENAPRNQPEYRKPPSFMLLIAKHRLDAGDIAGLAAMYGREEIANIHERDGGNSYSHIMEAGHDVAVALAKAGRLPEALRLSKGRPDTRVEIAALCHEKQDHAGVLLALAEENTGTTAGPWTASPRSYSRSGTTDSDSEASTPQLQWLAAAGAKAELAALHDYVENAQGYGLRVIAKARADAGDKTGARKLLEQGLEQAAVQRRVARQVQLIDALRSIGEAPLADAAMAVVEASKEVRPEMLQGGGEFDMYGQPARPDPATTDQLVRIVRAVENADPQMKLDSTLAAVRVADELLWPRAAETFNPNSFTGTAMNAQLLDQIERRWAQTERPPTLFGGASGEAADRIETLARELRLFRRATDYAIPQSLDELAAARKIDVAKLTAGDPASIEWVKGLPLDSGPQVVFIIDKKKRPGGINAVVTVPGLVEMLSDIELEKRLKSPPKVIHPSGEITTYPPDTRWAAYGEPPIVVDRRRIDPQDKAGSDKEFFTFANNGATRLLDKRLHNFAATIRAYVKVHGKDPESYERLRETGFLIHEEDITHPMGETFGYMLTGSRMDPFGRETMAIDSAQMLFMVAQNSKNGRDEQEAWVRSISWGGIIKHQRLIHTDTGMIPPLRTFQIAPNDPPHIKARKQAINLRTVLQKYADKNGGKFPPDLMDLVKEGYLPDDSALRSAIDPKVGFTYLPGQTVTSNGRSILFYDPATSGYPTSQAVLAAHVGLDVLYYPTKQDMIFIGTHPR